MTDNPLIRVVDDNESLRTSLEFMLSCEGYEVALFDSAAAFLTGDTPSRDGCVILDLQMPEMNGVELFDELCRRSYRVPVIFLTAHADVDTAVYTMRKGACDFLQNPVNPEKLLPAVARAVAKSRAAKLGMTSIEYEVRRYRLLTAREEQILRLVAMGCVSRVIAERLAISQRTVEHYRAQAVGKLQLRSAAELAAFFSRIYAWKEISLMTRMSDTSAPAAANSSKKHVRKTAASPRPLLNHASPVTMLWYASGVVLKK